MIRLDLILFFGGLGIIMLVLAPLITKDPAVIIIDVALGLVCIALAYITRHAEVEE